MTTATDVRLEIHHIDGLTKSATFDDSKMMNNGWLLGARIS